MLSPDYNRSRTRYPGKADPRPFREDHRHLLCLITDAVLAVRLAIRRWLSGRRTRLVLAALDEHQLRDIGLTRAGTRSETQV
jgi:uncharacterized protein YjiS (DUF1127 family)